MISKMPKMAVNDNNTSAQAGCSDWGRNLIARNGPAVTTPSRSARRKARNSFSRSEIRATDNQPDKISHPAACVIMYPGKAACSID